MPVFNIAANQIQPAGVKNYYEGRAMRANIGLAEKELEQADDILAMEQEKIAIAKKNAELREAEYRNKILEELAKASEEDQKKALRGSLAYLDRYEQAVTEGSTEDEAAILATESFGYAYGPDFADAMGEESVVPYDFARSIAAGAGEISAEEATKSQQTEFIGDDGKAHVGSFDPMTGLYTDASGRKHIKASPIAPQATQEDLLTRSDRSKQIVRDQDTIDKVSNNLALQRNFLTGVQRTPGAVGIRGAFGAFVAGYTAQAFGRSAGETVMEKISGGDVQEIEAIRTQGRLLVAQNLERITGEESGRYTEAERAIAENTLKNLRLDASVDQIIAANSVVLEADLNAEARARIRLSRPLRFNLEDQEGLDSFTTMLNDFGISEGRQIAMGESYNFTVQNVRE